MLVCSTAFAQIDPTLDKAVSKDQFHRAIVSVQEQLAGVNLTPETNNFCQHLHQMDVDGTPGRPQFDEMLEFTSPLSAKELMVLFATKTDFKNFRRVTKIVKPLADQPDRKVVFDYHMAGFGLVKMHEDKTITDSSTLLYVAIMDKADDYLHEKGQETSLVCVLGTSI